MEPQKEQKAERIEGLVDLSATSFGRDYRRSVNRVHRELLRPLLKDVAERLKRQEGKAFDSEGEMRRFAQEVNALMRSLSLKLKFPYGRDKGHGGGLGVAMILGVPTFVFRSSDGKRCVGGITVPPLRFKYYDYGEHRLGRPPE